MIDGTQNTEPSSDRAAFDAALLRQFASRQHLGAIATIIVAFAVVAVMWNHVSVGILAAWLLTHCAVALFSLTRLRGFRHINDTDPKVSIRVAEAIAWKAAAGIIWGALAVVAHWYLPQSIEFFTVITVAAVAVGGVSTMAAVPRAANAFALTCLAPFSVLWLARADSAHITLALLSLVLLAVVLTTVRISHRQLVVILQMEEDHRRLSEEYEAARGEWLELSDAAEAYVVFDSDDHLLSWNDRYAELLQVPEELLRRGTARTDIIRGGRQAIDVASGAVPIEAWLRTRTAPPEFGATETSIREYQGDVWIQKRVRQTNNGGTVVSFVDWTDMVEMQSALRESEERYRLIAENSPDAIFVRVEEKLVYVNPAAVTMLRAESKDALLGQSMTSFYHPGDLNVVLRNRERLAKNPDQPLPFARTRMRRFDGTYVMTEGSGAPHIWHGQPAILITRRDITAQIEAEERLRESEARYRRIAELSPVAMMIRVEDRIVYANPAAVKMFGAESEADLLYESMLSLIHPDDRKVVTDYRANISEDMQGPVPTMTVRRRRLDGTYFHGDGIGASFVWQGQPAVLMIMRDFATDLGADHPIKASAG